MSNGTSRKQLMAQTLDGQTIWTNGRMVYWIGEQDVEYEYEWNGRPRTGIRHGRPASQLLFSRTWNYDMLGRWTDRIAGQIGQPVTLVDGPDVVTHSI